MKTTKKVVATRSVGLIILIGFFMQMLSSFASAVVAEKNAVMPGGDGFISLMQYAETVSGEDNLYRVTLTVQPQIKPNGGDFVFLIDANENMLEQSTDGQTYFEHALDATYNASRILLDPTYNPLEKVGANQNRVWVVFYNGQAYNSDGTPLITGTNSTAYCYISDAMTGTTSTSTYPGTMPPTSQIRSFSTMKPLFDSLKANTTPFTSEKGLFNNDVDAYMQRYTAVGLAAAYDIFADYAAKGTGNEVNRKVVLLLSNGPDYERDVALSTNSENVPQEGSMRMEALFVSKALKFQTHSYDPSSTATGFGVSTEGDLKTAAASISSADGNTYYKGITDPTAAWGALSGADQTALIAAGAKFGNGLPLPVNFPGLTESVISLDAHKISITQPERDSVVDPFQAIYYNPLASDKDPFKISPNIKPITATVTDSIPVTMPTYQYRMFGYVPPSPTALAGLSPALGPDKLSPLNTATDSNYRKARQGYLNEHGLLPDYATYSGTASTMYTYADNKLVLKDTYDRIADEGGMSAEIWSVGLFVGSSSDVTNPGINSTSYPDSMKEMNHVALGFGYMDLKTYTATRWQQGESYRTDFTDYTYPQHTLLGSSGAVSGKGPNTWPVYDHVNPDYAAGPGINYTYDLSYIPKGVAGAGANYTVGISDISAGNVGLASAHQSPNILPSDYLASPSRAIYKIDQSTPGNAQWFTSLTYGSSASYSTTHLTTPAQTPDAGVTAYSQGISTQNNDTQGTKNAPDLLPWVVPWKSTYVAADSLLHKSPQQVPYNNGIDMAQRDKLHQHLKAISTVQASGLKDGSGFDPAKPWVNGTRIWTARQGFLTTSQRYEEGLIRKATVLYTPSPTGFAMTATSTEGINSYNSDWQNFYEGYQTYMMPYGYYTAIDQILTTDRETHPLSSKTELYDKEDFKPIVEMIQGPSMIGVDSKTGETTNLLVRTFENLVYDYYTISFDSKAYFELSNAFEFVHYDKTGPELRLIYKFAENLPTRYAANMSSATRNGQKVTWHFDKPMLTGGVYQLQFYVRMNYDVATDPDIYYPLQINSYIDFNIRTMTRDDNDNLIRLNVIKNFPHTYIKASPNKKADIMNKDEPIMETGSVVGIFPEVATTGNLPLAYYTPTVTPGPKPLADTKVDEGTVEALIPFGQ